jgi:6-phosphofructokinase 2
MPKAARPRIVTLTLNPSVDVSFSIDRLEPVRKMRCHDVRRDPGGGGINVARVIHRLGGQAVAVFPAGGSAGERLQVLLRKERLLCQIAPIAGETREDFTAEDRSAGAEYRFVLPGPRLTPSELAAVQIAALGLAPAFLVLSGSVPPAAPKTLLGRVAARARRAGAKVAVDAAGSPLAQALAAGVWLVKPNLAELEELAGRPLPDLESRLAACRRIIADGGAELVALSMGREGAMLVAEREAWRAAALAITPVSAIGAGDSFLAGFLFALARGGARPEALRYGVAAGSAALLAPGTQLARKADVIRLAPRVTVEPLRIKPLREPTSTRSRPAAA